MDDGRISELTEQRDLLVHHLDIDDRIYDPLTDDAFDTILEHAGNGHTSDHHRTYFGDFYIAIRIYEQPLSIYFIRIVNTIYRTNTQLILSPNTDINLIVCGDDVLIIRLV
jgi:hypothetical protein